MDCWPWVRVRSIGGLERRVGLSPHERIDDTSADDFVAVVDGVAPDSANLPAKPTHHQNADTSVVAHVEKDRS